MPSAIEFIAKIAPQINLDFSTEEKNIFIEISKNEVNENLFSDKNQLNLAIAYYSCHLMSLSKQDENSRGSLVMEKEGELQKNYSNTNSSETSTTQYLDSYNRIIENRIVPFYISNGSN